MQYRGTKKEQVVFRNVELGQAFLYNDGIYMRIPGCKKGNYSKNCVNLQNGNLHCFSGDTEITACPNAFVCDGLTEF